MIYAEEYIFSVPLYHIEEQQVGAIRGNANFLVEVKLEFSAYKEKKFLNYLRPQGNATGRKGLN